VLVRKQVKETDIVLPNNQRQHQHVLRGVLPLRICAKQVKWDGRKTRRELVIDTGRHLSLSLYLSLSHTHTHSLSLTYSHTHLLPESGETGRAEDAARVGDRAGGCARRGGTPAPGVNTYIHKIYIFVYI